MRHDCVIVQLRQNDVNTVSYFLVWRLYCLTTTVVTVCVKAKPRNGAQRHTTAPLCRCAPLRGFYRPDAFVTGRMPQSGKLLVLNLLTGQKSGFSPRRGDLLHRFTSKLAGATSRWVRLAVQFIVHIFCICSLTIIIWH